MKLCGKCKIKKQLSDFHSDRSQRDSLSKWCRSCKSAIQKVWRNANPRSTQDANLKKYGITKTIYDRLVELQNGLCAVCGNPPNGRGQANSRLNVDHDHGSGTIRGLLCNPCNLAIGHFRNSPTLLSNAILYLTTTPIGGAEVKLVNQ